MFAKVENGVTKLCQNFGRKNLKQKKTQFWPDFFLFFGAGSLVVREIRDRHDRISDKNSRKRIFWGVGSEINFLKNRRAHPVFIGEFSFFGRGKTTFFRGV